MTPPSPNRRALPVYVDRRTPKRRLDDHERLKVQLDRLGDKAGSHRYQSDLFATIRDSRLGRSPAYDIDKLSRADDFLVAVSGEVLVRSEHRAEATAHLEPHGFGTGTPVAALKDRVVRYTKQGASAAEASDRVGELQGAGIAATVNYVVPLGYIAKGEGGFENTEVVPGQQGPGPAVTDGPRVAVIDTGASAEVRTDDWLRNLTLGVTSGQDGTDPLYQPGQGDLLDFAAGHGTFVTGVIQQVAPTAHITCYRAVHSDGIGNELDIAAAILQAARDGAQVVNLSLGTETLGDQPPVGLQVALEILAEEHEDVLLVAAAGNSASTSPTWPAAFTQVVGVASLNAGLVGSTWSNHGTWVTCSTVGEGIVSTYVEGHEDPDVDKDDPDFFPASSWALGTGTSFAAPQVTGAVARLMADEGLTAHQALDALLTGPDAVADKNDGFGTSVRVLPGT